MVELMLVLFIGLAIGRWWAVFVTILYFVTVALLVYVGLYPGHPLATWNDVRNWLVAVAIGCCVTGIGVLTHVGIRRVQGGKVQHRS